MESFHISFQTYAGFQIKLLQPYSDEPHKYLYLWRIVSHVQYLMWKAISR